MRPRGSIINLLTFPGVMAHELGHQVFCHLTGTRVRTVCYFHFGDPLGCVKHDMPTSIGKYMLIGYGPLLVNSTIGFFAGLGAAASFSFASRYAGSCLTGVGVVLTWLAMSVALYSFPGIQDAQECWRVLWIIKSSRLMRSLFSVPLAGMMYFLGELHGTFFPALFYAFWMAWVLPHQVLGLPWF